MSVPRICLRKSARSQTAGWMSPPGRDHPLQAPRLIERCVRVCQVRVKRCRRLLRPADCMPLRVAEVLCVCVKRCNCRASRVRTGGVRLLCSDLGPISRQRGSATCCPPQPQLSVFRACSRSSIPQQDPSVEFCTD